ncbi:MAG: type II toxin-antitoxin system RelE/ParE family toxin [Spirochaetales bacterium]|nr:type II toxin-antitoxin system RelE/ParE family toxin [Spirochaetales bacterium]
MNIRIDSEAMQELEEAAEFYASHAVQLGLDFVAMVEKGLQQIAAHPDRYPFANEIPFRCYRLGRFPFDLFYRVEEAEIYVAAIAHQSRRPGYWKDRLKDG